MVPHETIEQKIVSVLPTREHSERVIAVVGVTDAMKGEALVILSSVDLDLPSVRAALFKIGVPNLWIPKTVRRVDAIPVLASGKLDLAECKTLAAEKQVSED
jgi:acyl-[acyl-carrier-protein]-phospholipid O-acyltransferase/long-chain-fatty-acid--[acyl-carrier-protein] ligase